MTAPRWVKCELCGRENSSETWVKFGDKCPNCLGLFDRDEENGDLQAGFIQADTAEIESLRTIQLNLAMLVRRLVRKLHQSAPTDPIIQQAMDFLARHGLQGSVLRAEAKENQIEQCVSCLADARDCTCKL